MAAILLITLTAIICFTLGRSYERRIWVDAEGNRRPQIKVVPPGPAETLMVGALLALWSFGLLFVTGVFIATSGKSLFLALFTSLWLGFGVYVWLQMAGRLVRGLRAMRGDGVA